MHKRRLLMDTKKIKAAIKDGLGKLYKAGFFSIIISQIIVKVVGFCNSIFLVWLLSKSDYGIYSYAQNYLSVILLLDGIGTISSIVQFGSENYNNPLKQVAFSRFGFSIGISFNSILGIGILIYSLVGYFSIEGSGYVLAVMSLQPVLSYVVNYYSVNLRYRLKNKCFSICNVVNSVLNVAALVIGAVIGEVYGVAAALYFSYLISIIIYIIIFAKMKINPFGESEKLGNADKKSFVKLSISAAINESILHLIMVADLFIIGIMIANELVVASYKVATVIPTALVFIPSSIMLFAYPYMARNKDNYKWNLKVLCCIVAFLGLINLLVVLILAIWAPFFINLIYGAQYLDAVPAFRILLLGYLFTGTIRTPIVNFLWSQKKNKLVICLSVLIGVFNVVADIVLVKFYAAIGAAIATAATYLLSAVLAIIFAIITLREIKKRAAVEDSSQFLTSNFALANDGEDCQSNAAVEKKQFLESGCDKETSNEELQDDSIIYNESSESKKCDCTYNEDDGKGNCNNNDNSGESNKT